MKTEKELLVITRDCLQNLRINLESGLCCYVTRLLNEGFITYDEHTFLRNTINNYQVPLRKRPDNIAYFFEPGEIEPRVKYLNQLIKMHHENYFIRNFWRFVYIKKFMKL